MENKNLLKDVKQGEYSHVEGYQTIANGFASHAEGNQTIANNDGEHAEGLFNVSNSGETFSTQTVHSVGIGTDITNRKNAFEIMRNGDIYVNGLGDYNGTYDDNAISIQKVIENIQINKGTVGESIENGGEIFNSYDGEFRNSAKGEYSHAEGYNTNASGLYSHAEGFKTQTLGNTSHSEGSGTTATGEASHAEGSGTTSIANMSHAEGSNTISSGAASHAEGYKSTSVGLYSHAEGLNTIAQGNASHAEGNETTSLGLYSHAEGSNTYANGLASHAEGQNSSTSGISSHAEGYNTVAYGDYSHSEGYNTASNGLTSHAEGYESIADGQYSHVEGYRTKAIDNCSHAEGQYTIASGKNSHAEGLYTKASGINAHAEGDANNAEGDASHAEGTHCEAIGLYSHAEGSYTYAKGDHSHTEGVGTRTELESGHAEGLQTHAKGLASHTEGEYTIAENRAEHASGFYNLSTSGVTLFSIGIGDKNVRRNAFEVSRNGNVYIKGVGGYDGTNPLGSQSITSIINQFQGVGSKYPNGGEIFNDYENNKAQGLYSHAEGFNTQASGNSSHSEGRQTQANGNMSHAEGDNSHANGYTAHAEGLYTQATGRASHSEGDSSQAIGDFAHAEGSHTKANGGGGSHAEGGYTYANGDHSHAEGISSQANGEASHAEGVNTITNNWGEHSEGRYNVSILSDDLSNQTIHTIGIGENNENRKNAFQVMSNGDIYIKGIGNFDGTTINGAKTIQTLIGNGGGGNNIATIDFNSLDTILDPTSSTIYIVTNEDVPCGILLSTNDAGTHARSQFLFSNFVIVDGQINTVNHVHNTTTILTRYWFNDKWSSWEYYLINDNAVSSIKTWSGQKINNELKQKFSSVYFNDILPYNIEYTPGELPDSTDDGSNIYYHPNKMQFMLKKDNNYYMTWGNSYLWNDTQPKALTKTYFINKNNNQYIFNGQNLCPTNEWTTILFNSVLDGSETIEPLGIDDKYTNSSDVYYSPKIKCFVCKVLTAGGIGSVTGKYYRTWANSNIWNDLLTNHPRTLVYFLGENGTQYTYINDNFVPTGNGGSGSGIVDSELSLTSTNPVQNKVITEELNKIMAAVFPLKVEVSGGGLFEKGTTQTITVKWVTKSGNETITPDQSTVNGEITEGNTKVFNDVKTTTKYTVVVTKDNNDAVGSTTATFVAPMYFGFNQNSDIQNITITSLNKQTIKINPSGDYTINNPENGYYLWLCIPQSMNINHVTSSGFEVPMETLVSSSTSIDTYKCYRSSNAINKGEMNFTIS